LAFTARRVIPSDNFIPSASNSGAEGPRASRSSQVEGPSISRRADEACGQLPADLLRRQFLEVAGVEAGGVVDQYVDATETVNGGAHP
jgi:hypothetical protein